MRRHVAARIVLTSSVCRELRDAGEDLISYRPFVALGLLSEWMLKNCPQSRRGNYEIDFSYGLADPEFTASADELRTELTLGSEVCTHYARLFTADNRHQQEDDRGRIVGALQAFLSRDGLPRAAT